MRFLDLELEDPVPDATTIWLFREALAEAGRIDQLFERFGQHLEAAGYIARGGEIVDATIVSVPKQRNTKEENEAIKAGKTPEGWEKQPAKNAQKDKDARRTRPCTTVRSWTMCSTSPTPARRSGRTAPTARSRSRRA